MANLAARDHALVMVAVGGPASLKPLPKMRDGILESSAVKSAEVPRCPAGTQTKGF